MTEDTHIQLQIMTDTALKFKRQLEQTSTLRDQFAMAALTGQCSQIFVPDAQTLADRCYEIADAMMEARK